MRIAYVCGTLQKGQDGVSRVLYRTIQGTLARNFEVMAIGAALPAVADRIVPMVKVPAIPFPLQPSYLLALPGSWFVPRLEAFDPDLLHLQSPCPLGFQALNFALERQIPVVATYHTHFPSYLRYYRLERMQFLVWRLLRSFYGQVDRTFVASKARLSELQQHGIANLQYLPNGVDLDQFSPVHRSAAWRSRLGVSDQPVVLFVSRLVWEKNLLVLKDMYNILRSRRHDFRMVVIGDGPARTTLESLMPGTVFLGYQQGKSLAESYASSDIFVFPSVTEVFGLVVLEAMASGLACVTVRAGPPGEIMGDGGSGLFAAPGPHDLAANVEWLLNHPDQWPVLGSGARQRAQQFLWDEVLDQLFAQYAEVVEASRS